MQEEAQSKLYEKMQAKIKKSENIRKLEGEKRLNKLMMQGESFYEKHNSCMEKKEMDSSILPPEESLHGIERKMVVSVSRKKQFLEGRKIKAAKHLEGIEQRKKRVKEEEEEQAKEKLERLLEKMQRVNINEWKELLIRNRKGVNQRQ